MKTKTSVSRKFPFDSAHRLPNHDSKCKNIHGHRYVLELTITGYVNTRTGDSSEGMVVDFAHLKKLVNEQLVQKWDHALLLWDKDPLLKTSNALEGQKLVLVPYVPTAENMAAHAFEVLKQSVASFFGTDVTLTNLRLYETPDCWVEIHG